MMTVCDCLGSAAWCHRDRDPSVSSDTPNPSTASKTFRYGNEGRFGGNLVPNGCFKVTEVGGHAHVATDLGDAVFGELAKCPRFGLTETEVLGIGEFPYVALHALGNEENEACSRSTGDGVVSESQCGVASWRRFHNGEYMVVFHGVPFNELGVIDLGRGRDRSQREADQ